MNPIHDRRGMTLVELIIVAVLGVVVLGAMFQILITNQRTFAAQSATVQDQQSLRAGVDVLFGELREISPVDEDIVSMASTSLHIRSNRSVGLVCGVATTGQNPTVLAKVLGRYLRGDSARVFYENDPRFAGDDDWRTAMVQVLDTSGVLTCPDGDEAQTVRLQRIRYGSLADGDSITPGAPIRNFNHYTYYLGTYAGEPFLLRDDDSGATAPLVGPLSSGNGVTFRYLDGAGAVTGTPADVRQIEVTLRTIADYIDREGNYLQDSLKVRIFTRNTN